MKLNIRFLIYLFIITPILTNCSPSSGGGSSSAPSSVSDTPSDGNQQTHNPPPQTTDPDPVECTGDNQTDNYNTSVTNHIVSQDDIAKACVDTASSYEDNISFSPMNVFQTVRFQTTCASRWCDQKLNDSAGVGVITSDMIWMNNSIDLSGLVQVQCRSSKSELAVDPCSSGHVPQKPLETFALGYEDPRCSFCGCDPGTVGSKWSQNKQALIDCGTAFCKAENSGFHWGILSEVNDSQFAIRCSRATIQ